MRAVSTTPGWYPDPDMYGTQRYWDGDEWTEHRAPVGTVAPKPTGFWTLTRAIALGILIAVACITVLYSIAHANDGLDCSLENVDRASNGQPLLDCG